MCIRFLRQDLQKIGDVFLLSTVSFFFKFGSEILYLLFAQPTDKMLCFIRFTKIYINDNASHKMEQNRNSLWSIMNYYFEDFTQLTYLFGAYIFSLQAHRKLFHNPQLQKNRSSHQSSLKIGVLKNFAKFTVKHLCLNLFLNKVAFVKKETLTQVFYCKFCEIFKKIFFTEHLRVTASGNSRVKYLTLTFQYLVSTKRSHNTETNLLQVCLSICDLFVETRYKRIKGSTYTEI